MSKPSEPATWEVYRATNRNRSLASCEFLLERAHNPTLGLDRSVCRRDVVEALHSDKAYYEITDGKPGMFEPVQAAADFIEREFGGKHD